MTTTVYRGGRLLEKDFDVTSEIHYVDDKALVELLEHDLQRYAFDDRSGVVDFCKLPTPPTSDADLPLNRWTANAPRCGRQFT